MYAVAAWEARKRKDVVGNNEITAAVTEARCRESMCAWWDANAKQCAVVSAGVALRHIAESHGSSDE